MIDPSILAPHRNIALHFSGGKDSLAVAHMLRPWWALITFYHLDAGDLLPEVREVVAYMRRQVPRFVTISTDSSAWAKANGLPSDLVPTSTTPFGRMIGMSERRIVDRFECCAQNLWLPMHDRMHADGITLVIRGTKRCDTRKMAAENGNRSAGYQIWLPIEDWSHEQVFAYLRENDLPICRVYDDAVNAPECATCSAWWTEGRAAYLAKHHPELAAVYQEKLAAVAAEVAPAWASLQAEVEHGE